MGDQSEVSISPNPNDPTTNVLDSFSGKLSSLHTLFESLLQQKEKLERELQLKYGMASI